MGKFASLSDLQKTRIDVKKNVKTAAQERERRERKEGKIRNKDRDEH